MTRWAVASLAFLASACAAPRLAEPWVVGGLLLRSPVGACLGGAIRTAPGIRFNGERIPGAAQTIQLYDFWVYGHYNDAGPRIISAQVLERSCPDGAYYLEVSANLAGSVADADPTRLAALVDDVVTHISTACRLDVIETDHARQQRSPKGRCS